MVPDGYEADSLEGSLHVRRGPNTLQLPHVGKSSAGQRSRDLCPYCW